MTWRLNNCVIIVILKFVWAKQIDYLSECVILKIVSWVVSVQLKFILAI